MDDNCSNTKLNNKGFTLLETMICFVLLGIIVVAASQIIQSNTKVYYETKSLSYGLQISQTTLTEIRGEIENAVTYALLQSNDGTGDPVYVDKYNGEYLALIGGDGTTYSAIEFVGSDGQQRKITLDTINNILIEDITPVYTRLFSKQKQKQATTQKKYDSAYIGMGYIIKDIKFSLVEKKTSGGELLPISNCPVIKIQLTVYNEKWGEYSSTDYAPLYNFTECGTGYIYK